MLDLGGATPRSATAPKRTVALTFDDGPDPRWTPAVLDVLRRHGVHATFFVVGARVLEHPELSRRIVGEGHELGIHTFTHVDCRSAARLASCDLQLSLTRAPSPARPGVAPGAVPAALLLDPDARERRRRSTAYRRGRRRGYLIVLTDYDSRGLAPTASTRIVARATPPGDAGGVILFHDGGGDRAQTVAALDRLLTSLQAGATGSRRSPSSRAARRRRAAAGATDRSGCRAGYCVRSRRPAPSWRSAMLRAAPRARPARARPHRAARRGSPAVTAASTAGRPVDPSFTPSVSVIVPAYNEAVGIARAVTLARPQRLSERRGDRRRRRLHRRHGRDRRTARPARRPRASARPTRASRPRSTPASPRPRGDIIVMVDGDTVFEPDTCSCLVQPFADPTRGRGRRQHQGRQPARAARADGSTSST